MAQIEQRRIERKPGDWHTYLMDAYSNCVNALRTQNAESSSLPVVGPRFSSFPSIQLFEGNVDILESMCIGYDYLDDDYREEIKKILAGYKPYTKIHEEYATILRPNRSIAFDKFAALTSLFKRKKLFKETGENLGHV